MKYIIETINIKTKQKLIFKADDKILQDTKDNREIITLNVEVKEGL